MPGVIATRTARTVTFRRTVRHETISSQVDLARRDGGPGKVFRVEMPRWDPSQYTKFERERTQPGRDLLARVDAASPSRVADLGCGPGNSTALLWERWPHARIEGIDSAEAMLAEARRRAPQHSWVLADAARWTPDSPCDVIFSNATLHWLPDHAALMPRLVSLLAAGGALAVQMPRNFAEPSHTAIAEAWADGPWVSRLAAPPGGAHVHEPSFYYDLLAPHATRVDLWETQYMHVLDNAAAVVEWVKGTALRPVIDALGPDEQPRFLDLYRAAIDRAYPTRADGKVLFSFRRLFFVAVR